MLQIDTRLTANTGYSIPQLGFGNALADFADQAVEAALKAGYRHFDTAQLYGTELSLSRALAKHLPALQIPRNDIVLVTKWNPPPMPGQGVPGEKADPSKQGVGEPGLSVDKVYEELLRSKKAIIEEGGMEYIDVMLIHQPRPGPQGRARAWEALQRAKKEGWVKEIGVSNFSIDMLKALPAPTPAINQIEIQPWHHPRQLTSYCESKGILLVAYCPLARASKEKLENEVVNSIMKRTGKNWGQILLRWSLQKGFIPIPRSSSIERIASNADLYDFELTDQEMEQMERLCPIVEDDREIGSGSAAPVAWEMVWGP